MPPPFLTTCPNCGDELVAVDTTNEPTWAPFLCAACARGWWPSELTPAARRAWDAPTRSFTDWAVVMDAHGDRAAAVAAFVKRKRGG